MELFILAQIVVSGAIGSFFYVMKDLANDTVREIIVSTGVGTTIAVSLAIIIYDVTQRQIASIGASMLLGALGPGYTKRIGEKVVDKYINK